MGSVAHGMFIFAALHMAYRTCHTGPSLRLALGGLLNQA